MEEEIGYETRAHGSDDTEGGAYLAHVLEDVNENDANLNSGIRCKAYIFASVTLMCQWLRGVICCRCRYDWGRHGRSR